jgi:hypothetical protein
MAFRYKPISMTALIALLSVVTGFFTAYIGGFDPSHMVPFYFGVLPYCLLLACFCVRPFYLIPVSILGYLVSWRVSFVAIDGMQNLLSRAFVTTAGDVPFFVRALYWAVPGLVGAIGVAVSTGIGARSLLWWLPILATGCLGAMTAVIFVTQGPVALYIGFALWQAAVGACLYWFSVNASVSVERF